MVNDGLPVFISARFFQRFPPRPLHFSPDGQSRLCLGHIEILIPVNRRDQHNPGQLGVILLDAAFINKVICLCIEEYMLSSL